MDKVPNFLGKIASNIRSLTKKIERRIEEGQQLSYKDNGGKNIDKNSYDPEFLAIMENSHKLYIRNNVSDDGDVSETKSGDVVGDGGTGSDAGSETSDVVAETAADSAAKIEQLEKVLDTINGKYDTLLKRIDQLNITKKMATLVGLSLEQFNLVAIDIKKTKDMEML